MRKNLSIVTLMIITLYTGYLAIGSVPASMPTYLNSPADDVVMKQDLLCLMMAYPEYVEGIEKDTTGKVYVIMKSGKRILYDDGKVKNTAEKEANPDLQDMMEQMYPLKPIKTLMEKDFNPGRIRVYPFLKEVYGSSMKQVQENLKTLKIGHKNYSFNSNNHAADALNSVMKELVPLAQSNNRIYANVFPVNGTFNYRVIAGTNRLSPHAFGIAIDLARDERDYWKWASREKGEARLKEYPCEIVEIFEKYGFIWGGKWGCFDILHFEYRPELIYKARYFSKGKVEGEPWYAGVDTQDELVKKCIHLIEEALKP